VADIALDNGLVFLHRHGGLRIGYHRLSNDYLDPIQAIDSVILAGMVDSSQRETEIGTS
jgi:hypothetical protein